MGVPQRSVLGTLLFNLYINYLFYIIKTYICNYADDITPYAADMSLDKLMEKLECAVQSAMEWFYYNGIKLNSGKCHLLVCGHKFECMICNIESSQVIETHVVKILGVKIESELTFNTHIEILCRKTSQKLNALSQFYYSPLVWMFCSRRLNTKINNLHYRALRMIYRDGTASFDELLTKDGSVTIHHRNWQCLAIEMFMVFKGVAPSFMSDVFEMKQNVNSENVSGEGGEGRGDFVST